MSKSKVVLDLIAQRIMQTWKIYALIFIPMWVMFVLNNSILFGLWNNFGVHPREVNVNNIVGILGSWTMHANFSHIRNNSLLMIQLLFLFGIFEKNVFRTIAMLIVGSGILTWLLGSANSNHIGASGLAFAMMGYMAGSALFARRWGYLIACIVLGTGFWLAMFKGLIPQMGISFAGHFGGLIAGLCYGASSKDNNNTVRIAR